MPAGYLVFCSIEPPEIAPERGYRPTPPEGLWLSDGEGAAPGSDSAAALPAIPDRCFLHWFFVQNWNRFIHVCARDASLTWLDAAVPAQGTTRALFPGDEIPEA